MSERLEDARRLGQRIDAAWRQEDVEAQLARLHVRQRVRARRRAVAMPLAAVAITAGVFVAISAARGPAAPRSVAVAPAPLPGDPATAEPVRTALAEPAVIAPAPVRPVEGPALPAGVLSLGDGSIVTPIGDASRLLARQVSDTEVVVAVTGGGARFDVPDRTARRFRAELGALAVETRGAAFRVAVTRQQIEVAAERGEVTARLGRERHVVAAGEVRAFAIAARDDAARVDRDEPAPTPAPATGWRDAAARGDYAAAWLALEHAPAALDAMEDLLLAGDVARLSGHAAAAVVRLARAVALHPDDPRAPLAAFTLGRVHLEDLGAPRDAARSFARARELAPTGPLAEDALAREVEAWSRAGETETARGLAESYVRRYPDGHRAHAVRRFGGLEGP